MSQHPLQLRAAYSVCRHIARSAARNFYYGFLLLPSRKRNALSAVYAFMRHADDLSDEPGIPADQRRQKLDDWMNALRRVVEGERTDDPVLFALADAQKRFNIPLDLLEKLVLGTEMDVSADAIKPDAPAKLQYETFARLYDYCYHVASVVGLCCIRIFGYREPRAEKLAEEVGVAFQLTNILRDMKEDAGRGRVYLPREDFTRLGIEVEALTSRSITQFAATPEPLPHRAKSGRAAQPGPAGGPGSTLASLRPLLEFEALRARGYYHSAEDLLPLIDEDSRAALWTLVEIYRRLLEKIIARNYDVFSERVRLSTAEKLSVMVRGFFRFR